MLVKTLVKVSVKNLVKGSSLDSDRVPYSVASEAIITTTVIINIIGLQLNQLQHQLPEIQVDPAELSTLSKIFLSGCY